MASEYRQWTVQDAKARFSELLTASETEGPQIVTKRGIEQAVVVPVHEWRRLQRSGKATLKELLLSRTPRLAIEIPKRGARKRRPPQPWG